jgi:shikimate kinase
MTNKTVLDSLAAKGIIPCAQQAMPAYATDGGGAVPRQSNVSFLQGGKVMVYLTDEQD